MNEDIVVCRNRFFVKIILKCVVLIWLSYFSPNDSEPPQYRSPVSKWCLCIWDLNSRTLYYEWFLTTNSGLLCLKKTVRIWESPCKQVLGLSPHILPRKYCKLTTPGRKCPVLNWRRKYAMKKQPNIRHMESRAVLGKALSISLWTVLLPSGWDSICTVMTGWKGSSMDWFRCS